MKSTMAFNQSERMTPTLAVTVLASSQITAVHTTNNYAPIFTLIVGGAGSIITSFGNMCRVIMYTHMHYAIVCWDTGRHYNNNIRSRSQICSRGMYSKREHLYIAFDTV